MDGGGAQAGRAGRVRAAGLVRSGQPSGPRLGLC